MNNANGQGKGGCSRILFSLCYSQEEDEMGTNKPHRARRSSGGEKRAQDVICCINKTSRTHTHNTHTDSHKSWSNRYHFFSLRTNYILLSYGSAVCRVVWLCFLWSISRQGGRCRGVFSSGEQVNIQFPGGILGEFLAPHLDWDEF